MGDNKRKQIPPKIRFEIFKRDKFTCQYCGRTSPNVVLQVDHILPVAEGGTNDIMNLITSCSECNIGKGKTLISDETAVVKQKKLLDELADKKEQVEMMIAWKKGLESIYDRMSEEIGGRFEGLFSVELSQEAYEQLDDIVKKYPFSDVWDAVEDAYKIYKDPNVAFSKLKGICHNKSKCTETSGNKSYYYNYLRKVSSNKFRYFQQQYLEPFVYSFINTDDDFEREKGIIFSCKTWNQYKEKIFERLNNEENKQNC